MTLSLLDPPVEARLASARQLRQVKDAFFVVSLAAYGISFGLPDASLDSHGPANWGYQLFLLGLLFCWMVPLSIPWWANVFFWWALCRWGRGDWSTGSRLALLAFGLACSAFVPFPGVMGWAFGCWAGSMATLALGGLVLRSHSLAY
jgi:hypothetical protein